MSQWEYWQKQDDEPLFPDIEWQKPEHKKQRGKLLVIGGNGQGFELPIKAGQLAGQAGAGEVQILLPDVLHRLLNDPKLPLIFSRSTPAGSFAKDDPELFGYLNWADHVLLAGDFGRNSETSLFFERLFESGLPLTLTKDAFYYANHHSQLLLERSHTNFVVSLSQLQRLIANTPRERALQSSMSLVDVVEYLHELTLDVGPNIVMHWQGNTVVAVNGDISTTKTETDDDNLWQLPTAVRMAVYDMQHPKKTFEALTAAVLDTTK